MSRKSNEREKRSLCRMSTLCGILLFTAGVTYNVREQLIINPEIKKRFDLLTTATAGVQQEDQQGHAVSQETLKIWTEESPGGKYRGSKVENYVLNHATELGHHTMNATCKLWTDPNTAPEIYDTLMQYREEVTNYTYLVHNYTSDIKDLRLHLDDNNESSTNSGPSICDSLELHKEGLPGIFKSGALSQGPNGYLEPLLPPLRDHEFCFHRRYVLSLKYLVHDFATMCQKLKRSSRIVFVDMGASLDFHSSSEMQPAVYITSLYQRFGFHFDHIYAYEIKEKKPANVFSSVPPELIAAYHWMNVAVEKDPASMLNPLKMLVDNYNEDDFIVIKLDIDYPDIEVPLAKQILADERIAKLVDTFYFEHHVRLHELSYAWGDELPEDVADSLELFRGLREKGVSAHFWI